MTDKIVELIERLRDAAALPNGLYAEAAEALAAIRSQRDEVIEEAAKIADFHDTLPHLPGACGAGSEDRRDRPISSALPATCYTPAMNPTLERLAMALTENGAKAAIRVIFQLSADDELVAAWQRTEGQAGDPIADLLAVEMERREIAF